MTLTKQLFVIIVVSFLIVFTGTFTISVNAYRNYISSQLSSHAQDTASSLGLSLTSNLKKNDLAAMDAMVSAIFDRGYYQKIWVTDVNGKVLVSKQQPLHIGGVPTWFVHLLSLKAPSVNAVIMSGWKQIGFVHVTSHPGYAYLDLWNSLLRLLVWFTFVVIATLIASLILLRIILRPLQQVRLQAIAICNRKFVVNEKLPITYELRVVVEAMNHMVKKLKRIFNDQMLLTGELQQQAYCDSVTGLGNRRFLNNQLQHLLMSHEEFYHGVMLMIGVNDLKDYNAAYGYTQGDKLLKLIADELQNCCGMINEYFLAHLSGGTFVILIPNISLERAAKFAEHICLTMRQLLLSDDHIELTLTANIGLASFSKGISATELLSAADLALREAELRGSFTYDYRQSETIPSWLLKGESKWRGWLENNIRQNNIVLHFQPVISLSNKTLFHYEALLRVMGDDGKLLTAGMIIPMAEHLGLMHEIDRIVVKQLINFASKNPNNRYAVNISRNSILQPGFINWLIAEMVSIGPIANNISVEVSEAIVVNHFEIVEKLADLLAEIGSSLAIDHLGRSVSQFIHLDKLKLSYVKLDGSYAADIDTSKDSQLFVRALAEVAHAMDIQVVAENIEKETQQEIFIKLNFDGLQGNLLGEPKAN